MAKRILAIDYGSKRIGLAITDPLGIMAQALPYLENKGFAVVVPQLRALCQEKGVELVIFGAPAMLDGSQGTQAEKYKTVATTFSQSLPIPLILFDERYTTKEAERFLIEEFDLSRKKRKELKDSLAACMLLRHYLQQNPS